MSALLLLAGASHLRGSLEGRDENIPVRDFQWVRAIQTVCEDKEGWYVEHYLDVLSAMRVLPARKETLISDYWLSCRLVLYEVTEGNRSNFPTKLPADCLSKVARRVSC